MDVLISRLLGRNHTIQFCILAAIVVAIFAFGCWDGAWQEPVDFRYHGGIRATSAAVLFCTVVGSSLLLGDMYSRSIHKSWWDPAERPDGDLDWEQLHQLVHRRHDPLAVTAGVRTTASLVGILLLVPLIAAIAGIAETAASFIVRPRMPGFLLVDSTSRNQVEALINLSGNLTAFLALIAASVSIWFAYSQLRAKVRADNRQAWLGKTRKLLARVIALGAAHAEAEGRARARLWAKLDAPRLELELMLNPSEKDHRLLMYLLRRLAFVHDLQRAEQADEGVLRNLIERACVEIGDSRPAFKDVDLYVVDWAPVLETTDPAKLVTYATRLGHVVLKREWQRVKNTQ